MSTSKFNFVPYRLELSRPFGTAHGVRTHTDIMLVGLGQDGLVGYGEASMPPYYEENQESMTRFFNKLDVEDILSCRSPKLLHSYLNTISATDFAAKTAVDIAFHDLITKREGLSIADYYSVPIRQDIISSYTIGISEKSEMLRKVREANEYPILKIKLNGKNDIEILQAIRSITEQELLIDANQAWNDINEAKEKAEEMRQIGIRMIEQPFPKGELNKVRLLAEATNIPIIADEDCQNLEDVHRLSKAYDGINIKLMKCSGIYEANEMIKRARQLDMKVMLGCMTETSIGISAATQLSSLVDWCDLDGNLLIDNDVCQGAKMEKGRLKIGLGPAGLCLTDIDSLNDLLGIGSTNRDQG